MEARAILTKLKKEIRSFNRRRRANARRNLPFEEDPAVERRYRILLGLDTKRGKSTTLLMRRRLVNKLVRERGEASVIVGEQFEVDMDFKIALRSVIDSLGTRKGRAPGMDGVYCEMLTDDLRLIERVILSLWEACGRLGKFPWLFSFELVEPVFKSGLRSDDERYREIGLLSQVRGVIDAALDSMVLDNYVRHIGQYGFLKKSGMENAILRLLSQMREHTGPACPLDFADAYPSVKRHRLLAMLKECLPPRLASMLSLGLLDGTRTIVNDDSGRLVPSVRGLTQGGRAVCTLFCIFIEHLLEALDPDCTGTKFVAVADDVTLIAEGGRDLQRALDICTTVSRPLGLSWGLKKCAVIEPKGEYHRVQLNGHELKGVESGVVLGFEISAGLGAKVEPKNAISRLNVATGLARMWTRQIPLDKRKPMFGWRRLIARGYITPVADYGLHLATWSSALEKAMTSFDAALASFVCGFRPKKGQLSRALSVMRMEQMAFRRCRRAADLLDDLSLKAGKVREKLTTLATPLYDNTCYWRTVTAGDL